MNIIPLSLTPEDKLLANRYARFAVRALYLELKAYPKPGLVSFVDAGAHKDMNSSTFYESIFTLRHYFSQIIKEGLISYSFETLKLTAILAEERMLKKTKGINTHRGAIFSLGLCCISSARLKKKNTSFLPLELHQQLIDDWQIHLRNHVGNTQSHGAMIRKEFDVVDAKQMAIRGYDRVFDLLPTFIELFLKTHSLDKACLFAYLTLLSTIDDTNVLYRKGTAGLAYAREMALEALAITCLEARHRYAIGMHRLFSKEGISPGGVADLIGILLFLGQLFCEQLQCHS